ncbi:hypothetical protein PV11_05249 [Exophiala sideris]|uniref:C2H2-type domain-containing protein n=1 Tax=Exophiala sideris TaxID=1016849 RepID=A0A0D1YPL6_9EURO|nr:hypothetical protein PV11_05249 [Exophiala sideris]
MAVDTEAIFSITPPPSEFDEFDKTGLLTCCSPSIPAFTYPSPAPSSSHGHTASVSSDSLFMLPGISMSEPQSHDLQHLSSFDDNPSDSASFFPVPTVSDPSGMAHYTTAATSNSTATANNPYNMYEQPGHWYQFPNYSQPTPMMPYETTTTTHTHFNNPFEHHSHQHSMANIIPPTPQDLHPSFDFNAPPLPSNAHLVASPSFSIVSHPSRSSLSSLSRSCSPIPSLTRGLSLESASFRPQMRSHSNSSSTSLHQYGIPVIEQHQPSMISTASLTPSSGGGNMQAWRCAYPGCTSRATFTRGCDLRKHYNRHSKHLFCRIDNCPQSESAAAARAKSADQPLTGGFSSKKDRARHEAKHNPGIKCEWRGADGEECSRVFSRMDNMKDHVRRIHNKGQAQPQQLQQQQQKPNQAQRSSRK